MRIWYPSQTSWNAYIIPESNQLVCVYDTRVKPAGMRIWYLSQTSWYAYMIPESNQLVCVYDSWVKPLACIWYMSQTSWYAYLIPESNQLVCVFDSWVKPAGIRTWFLLPGNWHASCQLQSVYDSCREGTAWTLSKLSAVVSFLSVYVKTWLEKCTQ